MEQTPDWDTDRCLNALKTVHQLEHQIESMRHIVPEMSYKLRDIFKVPEPVDFKSELRSAINAIAQDVRKFESDWMSNDVQDILKFTREGIDRGLPTQEEKDAWKVVTSIPTYTEDDERIVTGFWNRDDDDERFGLVLKNGEWVVPETTPQEEKEVFEKFQSEYANNGKVSTEWRTSGWMKVHISSGQYNLHFSIERVRNLETWEYDVKCSTRGDLGGAITGSMKARPRKMDLPYTLEMISAFQDVDSTACAKCHEHKDELGLLPAARRKKKGTRGWEAWHGGCTT